LKGYGSSSRKKSSIINKNDFIKETVGFFRGIRKYRDELRTLLSDNFTPMGT
jgi:hypothetical protein